MILEGIVTTVNADGGVNVAPMGPHLPDLKDAVEFPRRDPLEQFVLKPFRGSVTYENLKRHGEGVLHVTDDALLFAQTAVANPEPFPSLFPAQYVQGQVLRDACRYAEFRVTRWDEGERASCAVEVLHVGRLRDFFGCNRALFAVIEAAILATRVALLPLDQIDAEFRRLAVPVEKTGGVRERQAFAFLRSFLDAELQRRGTPA